MTGAELRMQKRYRSHVHKRGRCSVCQFRTDGAAGYHCKGWPDRAGTCDTDGKLPTFRFDDAVPATCPDRPNGVHCVRQSGGEGQNGC